MRRPRILTWKSPASHELHVAVRKPARTVPGAVHRPTRNEGIRHEAFRGQRGIAGIATPHADPTHEQLAGDALGQQAAVLVEDVEAGVGQWRADGRIALGKVVVFTGLEPGRVDRALGHAVAVDDAHGRRKQPANAPIGLHRQCIGADHDDTQVRQREVVFRHVVEERHGQRRGRFEEVDSRVSQAAVEEVRRGPLHVGTEHEPATEEQSAAEVLDEHVESEVGHLQQVG